MPGLTFIARRIFQEVSSCCRCYRRRTKNIYNVCYFCTYTHHKSINLAAVALSKCVCPCIDRYGTISCIWILPIHRLITKRESGIFQQRLEHFRWLYSQWPTGSDALLYFRCECTAAGPIWIIFCLKGQFDVREERASLAFNLYWLDFRLKCDHVSKIRFVINDPVALHLFAWFTVKIYIQFRIASNRYGIQCAIKLKYFMLRITSSKLDGKKLEINTSCRKNLLWVCEKFREYGNCLLS